MRDDDYCVLHLELPSSCHAACCAAAAVSVMQNSNLAVVLTTVQGEALPRSWARLRSCVLPEEALRYQRTLTGSPASLRKLKSVISACRSANVIHYVTFRRGFSGAEAHTMTCSLRAEHGKPPTLDGGFPYLSLARLAQWPRWQIRDQDEHPVGFHHRGVLPFPLFSHRCMRSTPLLMVFRPRYGMTQDGARETARIA
jgi:hypothetical protein